MGVGGVIFDGASVLLAKRGQEPAKGTWSLPGGAVELGEKVLDALKREIREEIGIEIEVGGLIRVLDRISLDQDRRIRYHYVIVDYWGWKVSGEPKPGSDTSDICFVPSQGDSQEGYPQGSPGNHSHGCRSSERERPNHRGSKDSRVQRQRSASLLDFRPGLPHQMEEPFPVGPRPVNDKRLAFDGF